MEPDDVPLHDLLDVGDSVGPGPGPLRAIVDRAGRRRRRMAAGGMAVALVVGGAVGYALSNHSSPAETTTGATPAASGGGLTSSSPSPGNTSGAVTGVAPGPPFGVGATGPLTRLFTRTTAAGVTLRAFRTAPPIPPGLSAGCGLGGPRLQVEVSTAAMAGTTVGFAPATHSKPVTAVESDLLGQPEGDPTAVIMAATGPTVTHVLVRFNGGAQDSMAPVDGWAVLASPAPATLTGGGAVGTLTATNAAGRVVGSSSLALNAVEPDPGNRASCPVACSIVSPGQPAASPGTTQPLIACAARPCPPVLPSRPSPLRKGAPGPATLPAVRAGGASACPAGQPGASSGASSGTAANPSAAG